MKRILKTVPWILLAIALLAVALWMVFRGRPCIDNGEGRAGAGQAPPGWAAPQTRETTPWLKKLLPWTRPTPTDEVMRGWPAGSKVVEVTTPGGETVRIGIVQRGDQVDVYVPDELVASTVIHEKPKRSPFGLRPYVGGGYGIDGPTAAAGVDIITFGRFRAGPAAAYDHEGFSGGGTAAVKLFGAVDARIYGGYGMGGAKVAALITIGVL